MFSTDNLRHYDEAAETRRGIAAAKWERRNNIKGYTVDEVEAVLDRIIKEIESGENKLRENREE